MTLFRKYYLESKSSLTKCSRALIRGNKMTFYGSLNFCILIVKNGVENFAADKNQALRITLTKTKTINNNERVNEKMLHQSDNEGKFCILWQNS